MTGDASIANDLTVEGDTFLNNDLTVEGDTVLEQDLNVQGATDLDGMYPCHIYWLSSQSLPSLTHIHTHKQYIRDA